MAKGDAIKVWFQVGDKAEQAIISASQNGRKVVVETTTKSIEVYEMTRGGTIVRRVWFPLSAVLCIDQEAREE